MLGTMCNVAKEFDGFMIPDLEQLILLANTVAGKSVATPPNSPPSVQRPVEVRRGVGRPRKYPRPPPQPREPREPDYELGEKGEFFQQQELQQRQQPYYPSSSRTKKVSAHYSRHERSSRFDPLESRQHHDHDLPMLHPQQEVVPMQSTQYAQQGAMPPHLQGIYRPAREREHAAAVTRERAQLVQSYEAEQARRNQANPLPVVAPAPLADTGGVQMFEDSEAMDKHNYEEKIAQRMVNDRKLFFLTQRMQKSISAHFSTDPSLVQGFCHSVRSHYEHLHVIVFLLEEIMQQFRAQHIAHTDMLQLASLVFHDSPALELEFRELVSEERLVSRPRLAAAGAEGAADEPPPKKPRILVLTSNLEADVCDPGPRTATTSLDMCYALLGQKSMSASVEHFLEKVRLRMGPEFRTFARLIAGAKYAFSKHMYMDLLAYIGRIKRILPCQFHHEFGGFFPICEAYQVYPHLRFRGLAKQELAKSSSPVTLHLGVRRELLNIQKASNKKLGERLAALKAMNNPLAPSPAYFPPPIPVLSLGPAGPGAHVQQNVTGQQRQDVSRGQSSTLHSHKTVPNLLQTMQHQWNPMLQAQLTPNQTINQSLTPAQQQLAHMHAQQQLVLQRHMVYQHMQQQLQQLQAQHLQLQVHAQTNQLSPTDQELNQRRLAVCLRQRDALVQQMAAHLQQEQPGIQLPQLPQLPIQQMQAPQQQ